MICDFGFNCRHYLPTLHKCRKLIDNYRIRKDLVEERWLGIRDVLIYLNLSSDALIRSFTSGEIKAKRQKDGKLMFGISVAAQYDDCFHTNSGSVCLYYEAHNGTKISCLEDLKHLDAEHPNMENVPSESDVRPLEDAINGIILSAPQPPCADDPRARGEDVNRTRDNAEQ